MSTSPSQDVLHVSRQARKDEAELFSIEAEDFLLSSVLIDETGKAFAIAQQVGIKPNSFHIPANRVVWESISDLWRQGQIADLATVGMDLKTKSRLDEVGGYAYLTTISGRMPTAMQVRYYAETVKLLWECRYAITLASVFIKTVNELEGREAFVKAAGELGNRLIRLGRRDTSQTLKELYSSVEEEARARNEGTVDKSSWISSGIPKFDEQAKRFGSAREDHFIALAAGSGHGKSVGLRQIAGAALREKKVVLSYSRETSTAGFIEMLVAAQLGFDLNKLEWQPKDRMALFYEECKRQREEWADKYLFCVQNEPATPLITVEDLCEHTRAFVHLHGVPAVILVDYLQIFDARKRIGGQNREATVAYVSHTLQALQRELGMVMVVAAQLNESGLNEMRQLKRDEKGKVIHRLPKPGDLRETQALYHDADRMIFLYKPAVDCCDRDQTSPSTLRPEVWWFQEKRRRGGIQIVRTWFEKQYTRFVAIGQEEITAGEKAAAAAAKTMPSPGRMTKADFMRSGLS